MKTQASKFIDHSEGMFKYAIQVARNKMDLSLIHCIQGLRKRQGSENRTLVIDNSCIRLSFYFKLLEQPDNRCILNGDIIFHATYINEFDRFSSPISVGFIPVIGWTIHYYIL